MIIIKNILNMNSSSYQRCFNKCFKLFVLLISLTYIISNPLITTYTQNDKLIKETLDDLISAFKTLRPEAIDLSGNKIDIKEQLYNSTTYNGALTNFNAEAPVFLPFDINGTIADLDVIFNNGDKQNSLQFDLICNYSITQNTTELKGLASIRFVSSLFNFRKGFDKNLTSYSMRPSLDIKFRFFDTNLLQAPEDRELLAEFFGDYLKNNDVVNQMALDVATYINKNIEKYFIDNTVEYYEVKLKNKPEPYTFSITPIMLPESINNGSLGQQNYLDGRVYDKFGAPVPGLDYTLSQTPIFKNQIDYRIKSAKQVFLSYRIFADLIKVDLMKSGEIVVYEENVDLSSMPFRFNIMYLNKFLPGINQVFSNSQKFSVEIKIKDVVFKYGENIEVEDPKEESFVVVYSDIFFKTADTQAGQVILEASLQTKTFIDVYRPVDSNKMNIKFRETIEIVECIPKKFVGYNFNSDNFIEEFEKSYSITNLGAFDYNLFEHPILLKDLIGENHEIIKTLKGIVLFEMDPPTPPQNKTLNFLQ